MTAFDISSFRCPKCGREMFVPRKKSQMRRKNHLKVLYCAYCKEEVNMKENRSFDFRERTLAEKEEDEEKEQ